MESVLGEPQNEARLEDRVSELIGPLELIESE